MGLTLETVASTTATATPDKQIAERGTGDAATVLYTVPTGRKFKGILTTSFGTDTGNTIVAYINGKHVQYMPKSGPIYIDLAAGAVVTCGSVTYATGVFGVESDA
jgi:hypothetical protein